jgi:hypothetical protein
MTSLIVPTYSLTLGNQRFTEQAVELRVTLELAPVLDSVTALFPAHVKLAAKAGDPALLTLGNGESEEPVFTGTIASIDRGFDAVRVRALDGGGMLAAFRPASTYEQTTAGDVAKSLCGDAGVDTGSIDDGVDLAFYAADPSRTAYEHIARVAGWSGAVARISAGGALDMTVLDATAADLALRYGRELGGITQESRPAAIDRFVVAGESGAGSTSVPEALRPATDFFGGNRPDAPALKARLTSEPALRTAAAAASAGAALQRSYGASRFRGTFDAFLLPKLRPGTVVQIQDLPEGLSGDLIWLRRVSHVVRRDGATTRTAFARGGDAFDPLALLGSLAGALAAAF